MRGSANPRVWRVERLSIGDLVSTFFVNCLCWHWGMKKKWVPGGGGFGSPFLRNMYMQFGEHSCQTYGWTIRPQQLRLVFLATTPNHLDASFPKNWMPLIGWCWYQYTRYIYTYMPYIYICFVRRSVLPIPPTNRTTKNTFRVRLISLTCFDRFQDLKMVVAAGCFHIIPCRNALFTNVIPLRKQLVYAYGFFQTVHRDVCFFGGVTSSSSSVGFKFPPF